MKKSFSRQSRQYRAKFPFFDPRVFIPRNPRALLSIFHSLKTRDFAIYFAGLSVTLTGSWIQQVAMGWLIYNMTGSIFMLSLSVFLSLIPTLFILPFAGVLVDRFDRRKILVCTQSSLMFQSLLLGVLTVAGWINIEFILGLSLVFGIITSFDAPARQAFYSKLVPPEDMANAVALNSTAINGTRFIGPALGGVIVNLWGEGVCFLINAACFLAILVSLTFIRSPKIPPHGEGSGALREIAEGFKYAVDVLPIRAVILLLLVFSFFGLPFTMLMPAFAKETLNGDSEILGNLMSFIGIGAVSAALYLAARRSAFGLGRVIVLSCSLFGAGLALISFTKSVGAAYALCVPIGFGMIAVAASCNTMLQSLVDDSKRGRIMSMFSMCFFGIPPVGSIIQGWVAKFVPFELITLSCGVVCVAAALVFEYFRPAIRSYAREIYAKNGIVIPEIAEGLRYANRKGVG